MGSALDEMLRHADLAMYAAKAAGRDQAYTYDPSMQSAVTVRGELDGELRKAIDDGDLVVYYQPIVDAVSGAVCSVEALIRWDHPERGVLPPSAFLATAERSDLIVEIGRFVLSTACKQTAVWRDYWPDLCVAVNIAHRELVQPDFASNVTTVLEETGLPAGALHLEITETVLAVEDNIARTVEPLMALGVQLSVDDFGTGHSSLSRLRDLSVSRLKIDRSFITEITDDRTGIAPLLASIIDLGHSIGHIVVAAGVETPTQAAFLTAHGCDELQGYYFGPEDVKAGETGSFRRSV